jgi:diaminohydroxyphosphoribosylaminopyrimidine deaminase/5-amino-6-(5-phosphoribosylamino)uracil reductase
VSQHLDIREALLNALQQAKLGQGHCAPNPSVGAIVTDSNNKIIAADYHRGPGLAHAEIMVLNKLKNITDNAILYVTLEPCSHYGKTPPCTDAIIRSGIKKIIYAYQDPNPIVSGNSKRILNDAGIICEHYPLTEIDNFYNSYRYWCATKKPYITAKLALTLDGKIAGKNSQPVKITGSKINVYTHQQRKNHDAILTTVKTVIADDPQLNARVDNQIFSKPLYILDRKLQLPLNAKIFTTTKSITVFHEKQLADDKIQRLTALGVRCIETEVNQFELCLNQIIKQIGRDGMHTLWIEAGGKCFSSFIEKQLLQRVLIYLAPCLLGEGQNAFTSTLKIDFASQNINWKQIGNDVLCEIYFQNEKA